jgi:hypothetical protein
VHFFSLWPIGEGLKSYLKLAQSPKPSSYYHFPIILNQNAKWTKLAIGFHLNKISTAVHVPQKQQTYSLLAACLEAQNVQGTPSMFHILPLSKNANECINTKPIYNMD